MSLLNPTPGEIADRILIVRLKIAAYGKAGRDTRRLKAELNHLEAYSIPISCLTRSLWAAPSIVYVMLCELRNVNAELWDYENRVRSLPDPDHSNPYPDDDDVLELAVVAKHIASKNDRRAKLIREIDKAIGCPELVEEKIYALTT